MMEGDMRMQEWLEKMKKEGKLREPTEDSTCLHQEERLTLNMWS